MSPLLTARPSVSVTLRLIGACVVMTLAAAAVPFFGADGRSSAAVPAALALGITCAALLSHLLFASAKATDDLKQALDYLRKQKHRASILTRDPPAR